MPYFYIDYWYIVLVVPAIILAFVANINVKSTFARYSKVASGGMTGAESARRMLAANGVTGVRIERVSGDLTDHFDPRTNTIRLSEQVYDAQTVAAVGVAAHEAGHAVQYAQSYAPMKLRAAIIPVTNIGSRLAVPLVLLGLVLGSMLLADIGILAFSLSTLFQLVTLPVEFNASRRALQTLEASCVGNEAVRGSKSVLRAAALTYVAALAVSLASLLRLVLIVKGRNRD